MAVAQLYLVRSIGMVIILGAGGGANQGAVILISWAAALLIIALALIARRIKRTSLSLAVIIFGAVALAVSVIVSQLFGWWHGPIISATIILLPIVLEIYALALVLRTRKT